MVSSVVNAECYKQAASSVLREVSAVQEGVMGSTSRISIPECPLQVAVDESVSQLICHSAQLRAS